MRKLKQSAIFAVAIAFFFGAIAINNADAQIKTQILQRMQKHKDALQSLKADVSMKNTDALLGVSDTKTGTTYYLPGKGRDPFVRVNWLKPLEETLVVKNGKYIMYQPRLKQAITGKVSDSSKNAKTNNAMDFMNMSKRELDANYKIQMLDNARISGDEVWHLKLTPKKRKSYSYTELWVNTDGMPVRMMMVENNDDSTTVNLSNIKKNIQGFKVSIFDLELPSDTNIV